LPGADPRLLAPNLARVVEVFTAEDPPRPRPLAARGARRRAALGLGPVAAALLKADAGCAEEGEPSLEEIEGALAPAVALGAGEPEAADLAAGLLAGGAGDGPLLPRLEAARAALGAILRAARAELPRAAVYHALSSGLDGLAGALAARRTGAPLVLTAEGPGLAREAPDRRLARRLAFRRAAAVAASSDAARAALARAGAPDARAVVIPPGIAVDALAGLRAGGRPTEEKDALVVALLAPVVPSEDVKTFIRAAKLLVERLDLVEVLVVGSRDADDRYVRECMMLAQTLGIDRLLRFVGPFAPADLFPHLDCACLLGAGAGGARRLCEAVAAGVPAVATDVAAHRELLEGRQAEDRALGPAGLLAPVASHEAVAAAIERVLRDHALRRRLVEAGLARASRFWRRERAHEAYRALYERVRRAAP
jgi:glycosyltransferase involved in cell wall biosynthesis